ncbi:sensor domain-containing diguanylate cyclase [Marinomonas dokdonensis]|uniref:sensor domain-containing diguanylate cyclase n=1 Tax=Marinomonas dokdonensis TaxID=328224 RepID=UPI0040559AA4
MLRFILSIRLLIVSLALAGVIFTILNGYSSTYQLQQNLLVNISKEANRVYAQKLARMTQSFITNRQEQLRIGAEFLSALAEQEGEDSKALQSRLKFILDMSNGFNSISLINVSGAITAVVPAELDLKGTHLSHSQHDIFNDGKAHLIGPVVGPTGKLLIFISHPVRNSSNDRIADLVGTIYLQDNIFLNRLLSQHDYDDGSYVYVVSSQKELIYHPLKERIGEKITTNTVINNVIDGKKGAMEVVNSKGVSMVAGYAHVAEPDWGVVAQTPRAAILNDFDHQLWLVLKDAIPLQIVILIFVVVCAYLIARPLRMLAESTNNRDQAVKVKAWFYEAYLLKRSIRKEIDSLNEKVTRFDEDRKKDPLTGLMNRRAMDELVTTLVRKKHPFSVIFFDIDHFKSVNDEFGHDTGDEVLKALADMVSNKVEPSGVLFRSGGEEFVVIVPDNKPHSAIRLAEDIRQLVMSEKIPQIGKAITVSLGVSNWIHSMDQSQTFKRADLAMYESKKSGRNRVTSRLY